MCVHFFLFYSFFDKSLLLFLRFVLFPVLVFFNRIIGFSYLFISIIENIITYLNGIRILIKQFMFFLFIFFFFFLIGYSFVAITAMPQESIKINICCTVF